MVRMVIEVAGLEFRIVELSMAGGGDKSERERLRPDGFRPPMEGGWRLKPEKTCDEGRWCSGGLMVRPPARVEGW